MMPEESSIIVGKKEEEKLGERRIEESYNLCPIFPSVQDRYYTKFYYRDPDRERHLDQVLLLHSNRIVLVTLAPRHPLLCTSSATPFQVDYRVTPNCDRSLNASRGKGKRGAQGLDSNSNLCFVKPQGSSDSEFYRVKSLVKGKLLEVNEYLIKDPELLRKDPQGSGYIALILPTLPDGLHEIKTRYLTQEEYLKEEEEN